MPQTTDSTADADGKAVARSTFGVSAITLVSRLLGLVRDKCLVLLLGQTVWVLDAFVLAFTIPNLFRRLFGEGALTAAFVPVFVRTREREGADEANRLASAILTLLALVTGGLAAAGMLACLAGDALFEPSDRMALTLKLTAAMLPFLCLICCSALLAGMLQSVRIFSLPAAMPVVLNLCFLGAFAWLSVARPGLSPAQQAFYVAGAVVLAAAIQTLVQTPILRLHGVRLFPSFSWKHPGVTEVLRAMGPTALGLGVVQINVLLDNLIAYGLSLHGAEGANTYLYLGNRLMQLPLGVFGIAVATTVFPYLARHAARKEHKPLVGRLETSVRMVLFIVLPAAVGLAVCSDPVVRMIYQEPDLAFSDAAVYRTARVLALYATGLVFYSLQHLLTRVYYARGDYATPVRFAVWMVGANLVLNLSLIYAPDLFVRWSGYAVEGPAASYLLESGLALATSLAAGLNVALLWTRLRGQLRTEAGEKTWDGAAEAMAWALGRIFLASVAMGVLVYFCVNSIPYEPELWIRIERGLTPVAAGILFYIVACLVIPVPELEEFLFRRKPDAPPSAGEPTSPKS